MADKILTDYTDDEIRKILSHKAEHTHLSYNDFLHELDRRRQQRNADRTFKISLVALIISVISLFGSLLTALLK